MKTFSTVRLPSTFQLKAISFYSSWYGELVNLTQIQAGGRIYSFGYLYRNEEIESTRAVVLIEEKDRFPLETRSMIWRIAEIAVERQNEWLVFSRAQNDFSTDALSDFVVDSKNYRDHLRNQNKDFAPA